VAGAAPGGDQGAYGRAFDALKAADYTSAITQFRDFLKTYPQSALADNAQYWLGEAYYVTRDFDSAAAAFRAVGEHYPQSRKAPDALLKLGYTQFEQKRLADARTTLGQVVQRFPGSQAAQLAADRLQKLPAEASSPAAP
jgi:tol-pal system protein YbgF